jgi:hypothetical protein
MMTWMYRDKELIDENIPPKALGFIYMLKQKSTGKKYIGRKLLTSAASKVVNGKKKRVRKESDWRSYWSSSPSIKEYIKEHGTDDFTREILTFVSSKAELMYAEEYCLYLTDALLDSTWMNENIRAKVMRSWFQNKPNFINDIHQLRKTLYQ